MVYFDSHCHLTSEAFEGELEAVIERARTAGVGLMTCIASTPTDALVAVDIARAHTGIVCTAGVHPHEAGSADEAMLAQVRELLALPEVRAVGECGLDFHYDFVPQAKQFEVFEGQIAMSADHGLPLVVHCRSADEQMIGYLKGMPSGVAGVLHCFSGSDELLDTALAAGWYISFSGIVTFKRFEGQEQVARVPLDRMLIETDSPYLAPVPHRGKRNEPGFVGLTLAQVAHMRGVAPSDLAAATTANALRFYGLDPDDAGVPTGHERGTP